MGKFSSKNLEIHQQKLGFHGGLCTLHYIYIYTYIIYIFYIYYICYIYIIYIYVCVCVSMVSIFPRTFDGDLLWGCDQTCSWHIIRASYRKATELICYGEKMAKLGNLGVYDVCVYISIYIHEKFKVATVVSPSLSLCCRSCAHFGLLGTAGSRPVDPSC